MFYALAWSAVLMLLALWSLTVWALHAAAAWAVSSAGSLSGAASGWEGPVLPDWLAVWMPAEAVQALGTTLSGLAPYVESLLQASPALAGGLGVVAWVVWALGSAALMLLGAGLHLAIVFWRRRASQPASRVVGALPAN